MAPFHVVDAVCRLASDFRSGGDESIVALLERSGYLQDPNLVTEEPLKAYLQEHSDLIEAWAILSVDQRSSNTWYMNAPHASDPNVQWAVGFYPGAAPRVYPDGPSACAAFIVRYIDLVRKGMRHAS